MEQQDAFKSFAIIVAGGKGTRMGTETPKQFLLIGRYPILMHTLLRMNQASPEATLVVVLPSWHLEIWAKMLEAYPDFQVPHCVVAGGETRFHSVYNGLQEVLALNGSGQQAVVAVHDGVRPFVKPSVIQAAFQLAGQKGSGVVAVPLKDSIRAIQPEGGSQAANREAFRLVQTPQVFRLDWMQNAFNQPYSPLFTDCASVLEQAGFPIYLVEGNYENIKITTEEDLLICESFLKTGV